jgi:photosystem II stability/assembly factor-like uncharacterized protein
VGCIFATIIKASCYFTIKLCIDGYAEEESMVAKKRINLISLFLIGTLLIVNYGGATSNPNILLTWVKTGGPIGGLGYDIRFGASSNGTIDPSVMYVTDNYSGVNKSVDGGLTWLTSNNGITKKTGPSGDAISVFSLTVDPNNGNNIWVGLKDRTGVYRSYNAGASWVEVPLPAWIEPDFAFRGFSIQNGNSNIVYAAGEAPGHVNGKEFDKVHGRVIRTVDGGATWTSVWYGDNLARYVIINPNNEYQLYISTGIFDREAYNSDCTGNPPNNPGGVGVIKAVSYDRGLNWVTTSINNGLTDLYVGSLVLHPANPNILMAGAGNNSCSFLPGNVSTGGVFLTENGGQTWTKTLGNDEIISVDFSPTQPNVAYAGSKFHFYRSLNGGHTWETVSKGGFCWGPPGIIAGFPIDILVDPRDPFTLFANNYGGGAVKSTDGGVNWLVASKGYTGALMFDLAVHPTHPGVVYSTARSGIFGSSNGGGTWYGLNKIPMYFVETYSVALKPDNPHIVLATSELEGTIFRSVDSGSNWTNVFTLPGSVPGDPTVALGFKHMVFAPSSTDLIYAGTCKGINLLQTTSTCKGIYRSLDGGLTWEEANDANTANQCIHDIAIHPIYPGLIYAASNSGGLFRTFDGGAVWQKLSLPFSDVRSVAIRPDKPNLVYAGTDGAGVYISNNNGDTWTQVMTGMNANESIWSIVFDPTWPEVAWAASINSGAYRWDPIERIWTLVNSGLETREITRLAFSADGSVLYANTWGGGVYRMGEVPPLSYNYLPAIRK